MRINIKIDFLVQNIGFKIYMFKNVKNSNLSRIVIPFTTKLFSYKYYSSECH